MSSPNTSTPNLCLADGERKDNSSSHVFARKIIKMEKTPSTTSPSKPSLVFRDVSPITFLTVRRGRTQYRVRPYSAEHAFLTGRTGTPTRSGLPSSSLPLLLTRRNDCDTDLEDNHDISTPTFKIRARLSWTAADVAAVSSLAHLSGLENDSTNPFTQEDAVGALEVDTASVTGSAASDEQDSGDGNYSSPNFGGLAVDRENSDSSPERTPRAPFVAVPVEQINRVARSPYVLRRTNRASRARIQEQMNAVGLPLDAMFLKQANIKKFNPAAKRIHTMQALLFRCTTFLAIGITLSEFGRIMRACIKCDRYAFVESIAGHDCGSAPYDPEADEYSITAAVYRPRCPGMDAKDFEKVFLVCDTCHRVYMKKYSYMHDCTEPGDADDADLQ